MNRSKKLHPQRAAVLAACAVLGLLLNACGGGGAGAGGNPSPPVPVPPNDTERWVIAPAAEVGMDGAMLGRAVSELPAPAVHGMASMLVLRHGKPVLEQYWNGYNKDTLHDLRSATKSITSLLVGIAIDQHLVGSVDDPISKYLGAAYPGAPALKQNITLANVLTMSSGLACDDRDAGSPGNEDKMVNTGDWVGFFVNLPQRAAPGGDGHYCTAGAVALGRVVAEASKQSIPAFASAGLFNPLGITQARWADFDNHRQTDTGGHLQLRPRDLAKLGQLVLQGGVWEGKQVVSADWIARSTGKQALIDNGWKYGYLWWLHFEQVGGKQVTMSFAWGNGGQMIFIIPEADLVVVFTGENYNSDKADRPFDILRNYVLPAVQKL
jgi:CubicO group peptidase (beta-lactamase class C family)